MSKFLRVFALIILTTGIFAVATLIQSKSTFAAISAPISTPVSPSPTASPIATTAPANNNSGDNNSPASAPVCNDQKPGSAPQIISIVNSGSNKVTLTWTKAKDPVNYYLITYGLKSGQMLYGNPNVGNVTQFTVSGLNINNTYYFKVRGGNSCAPGDFSNEASIKVRGVVTNTNTPATGFSAGVLGSQISESQVSTREPIILRPSTDQSKNETKPVKTNIFTAIFNFFKNLFK